MNNDNEANDANDDGEELYVGLPEPERQELLRQRREIAREIQLLGQERDRLLLERQRQLFLLEQRRQLEEQAETRRLWQENAKDRLAYMVRVARRQEPSQRQAFETHVLERQQQQQAESVEEGTEEDTDTVSLSMVEPNP